MRVIGVLMLVVGGAVMLFGLGGALLELVGAYRGVLDDALNTPAIDDESRSTRMLIFAAIGAVGFVPALAGFIMLWAGIIRRRRVRHEANATTGGR